MYSLSTKVTTYWTGVGVLFKRRFLRNHSIVSVDEIDEGHLALVCFTDDPECCDVDRGQGKWFSPDGGTVVVGYDDGGGSGVYEGRGPSILTLSRRHGVRVESGLYYCEVPDAEGRNRMVYVGLYSNGTDLGVWEECHLHTTNE